MDEVKPSLEGKAPVQHQIGWAIVGELRKLVALMRENTTAVQANSILIGELLASFGYPASFGQESTKGKGGSND